MAKNIIFGYARVSATDQNLDSQKALLIKAGCEQILEESISGKASVACAINAND